MLSANICLSLCVVHHQEIALNDIFSETTKSRAFIFGMKHCLVNIYHVCSNACHGVINDPAAMGFGFQNKIKYTQQLFFRTSRPRCLKCGI